VSRRKALAAMLVAIGGTAISVGSAADATVGPECVGNTAAAVCVWVDPAGLPTVDPSGGPGIHDCVYAGPPPCKPVDLPTPSVSGGSDPWAVQIACGGTAIVCKTIDIP